MAIATEDLRFRVLAQVLGAQAIGGLKTQIDGVAKSTNQLSGIAGKAVTAFKAFAALYGVQQGVQLATSLIKTADEMDNVSQRTGIAVEVLSQFKGSVDAANMPIESFGAFLNKLSKTMVDAATGSKEAANAFKSIGVSVKGADGQIRPVDKVLLDISSKFAGLRDGPEKAAIAMKLFGKSGAELIPFLNQGADGLTKFGLAITTDFASRAATFTDTLTGIGVAFKNAGIEALGPMLPTLQAVANVILDIAKSDSLPKEAFEDLAEAVRLAAVMFNSLYTGSTIAIDYLSSVGRAVISDLRAQFKSFGTELSTMTKTLAFLSTGNYGAAIIQIGKGLFASKAKEDTTEADKIMAAFYARAEKRLTDGARRQKELLDNSLVFGSGTREQILARQRKETESAPGRNTTGDRPNVEALKTAERDRVKEFIEQQKLENEQRKLALGDINLTSIELLKVTEARKLESEAIKAGKTMTAEQRAELMKATEEITKQRLALIDLEQAQKRSFAGGLKEGLRTYADEATNVGKQISDAVKSSFTAMEGALLNFVKTGKAEFKDFANSVIDDLIRIAIRKGITGPLADGFGSLFSVGGGSSSAVSSVGTSIGGYMTNGFANGGIMTAGGPVPLRKYAAGGIANSPQLALYGEGSKPEAYVPLPDGRSIPVTMQNGGSTFNININVDQAGSTSTTGTAEEGKRLGGLITAAVKSVLLTEMRPGGMLA